MSGVAEISLVKVSDCCEILDSHRIPLNSEERDKIPGDVPYYGANGVQGYISKHLFDEDLILIAEDGGNFDQYADRSIAYRISGKSWVNNHAHILRARSDYDQNFVFYSLEHKNICSVIKGGTRSKLNQSELREITIWDAPRRDQQKIAHILTTVDNLIEKTQALIDKYTAVKQGMMHDLFTRGIDLATGQLRPSYEQAPELYKETELGWVPREWGVYELKNVLDFFDGHRIPLKSEDRYFMQGPYPYYGASGIIDYVNSYIFDGDYILLGEDGENVVSRNVPLAFRVSGKIWVNNHAHVLKPKSGHSLDFYVEYLEFLNYENIVSGSAQPKITQSQLARLFVISPDLHEQVKISEVISALEAKKQREVDSLGKLREQKKGLMQDLLTGRVRVA